METKEILEKCIATAEDHASQGWLMGLDPAQIEEMADCTFEEAERTHDAIGRMSFQSRFGGR